MTQGQTFGLIAAIVGVTALLWSIVYGISTARAQKRRLRRVGVALLAAALLAYLLVSALAKESRPIEVAPVASRPADNLTGEVRAVSTAIEVVPVAPKPAEGLDPAAGPSKGIVRAATSLSRHERGNSEAPPFGGQKRPQPRLLRPAPLGQHIVNKDGVVVNNSDGAKVENVQINLNRSAE